MPSSGYVLQGACCSNRSTDWLGPRRAPRRGDREASAAYARVARRAECQEARGLFEPLGFFAEVRGSGEFRSAAETMLQRGAREGTSRVADAAMGPAWPEHRDPGS